MRKISMLVLLVSIGLSSAVAENIAPLSVPGVDTYESYLYDAAKLIDENTATFWNSLGDTVEHWATLTWSSYSMATINSITVDPYRDAYPMRSLQEFAIDIWQDGDWVEVDYCSDLGTDYWPVSYTHLRAHET